MATGEEERILTSILSPVEATGLQPRSSLQIIDPTARKKSRPWCRVPGKPAPPRRFTATFASPPGRIRELDRQEECAIVLHMDRNDKAGDAER